MGFNDEYLKLRKKRLEAEESRRENTNQNKVYVDTLFPKASSDIAPVRQTAEKKQTTTTDERKWFEKGAFEDGWQPFDLLKTIYGSQVDLKKNALSGIIGMGEKAIDTGAYIVGGVGGLFSKDFKDDVGSFIKKDLYDEEAVAKAIISAPAKKLLGVDSETDSVFGAKSDALAQSGGQLLGTIGLQAVGVPWFVTSGVTSFGSEAENALQQGATYGQAGLSAAINAGVEIATEKLFGGSGLGEKGLINLDGLTKGISNKVAKAIADFGIDMAAEGTEEFVAQIGSNFASALYSEKNLQELLLSEEAFDEYLESFIGGMALGGVANVGKVGNSIKTGRDYHTGLTENEQKVFDNVYNKRIAEAEEGGKELSTKEKDAIYDAVMNDLEKGRIDIDTIEETLGEDVYKSYKDTIDYEDDILKQFEELGKKTNPTLADQSLYAELKSQADGIKQNSQREEIKSRLSEEVFGKVKDTKLAESYNERARRGQHFEADLSQYDEKQQEVIKRAVESGILNNTNRTHEFVDLIAKISADKGVLFDFTNNAKLKESGFAVDGKEVNGFVTKDGISINIDSHKALQSTVGHEITHVLEGTELYAEMQRALFDYAKSKGDFDGRRQSLAELYKDIKDADVDAELTADLVGDYLFTDEDFVKHLSTQNRNVFQKIYDEIKYLWKLATAGGKEARELEKVKRAFDKAYRESGKASGNTETKYALSKDVNGDVFVDVTEDIFDSNNGESVARTIQRVIHERFNNLVDVHGQKIQVNKTTNDEFRKSESARTLLENDTQSYNDKLKTIANADEILTAAKNWIGEEIKHIRKDDIVEFARGNVMYRVGENGYVADVIVGTRKNGSAVLYDLVNIYEKKITEDQVTMASNNSSQRRQGTSADGIISQNSEKSSGFAKNSLSDRKNSLSDKNIKDISTGYVSGESYYTMSYTQDGKVVGTLEYGEYDGAPNVKMIEVEPEYRRKGIATKLMQELQKKYPDAEIDFGMSTPDGTKLLDAITYDVTDEAVVADREKLKGLQTELNDLQGQLDALFELIDNGQELTEAQDTELHELGDRWQEVYETIRDLEKSVKGKRATKTFVKTDANIRYSLSSDSEGRTLSDEQKKYFKDSKIVDDNGNLKVVYHGSGAEFTEFSYDFMSTHGSMEGQGFYFTDSKTMAEGYQKNGAKLMEGYLDIKKPLSDSEKTLSRAEVTKLIKAIDPTGDDVVINYDPMGGMGYPSKAWYNRALAATVDNIIQYCDTDSEILADIANSGAGTEAVVRKAREVLGYDGYIVRGKYDGADVYVAFESNQFKNIDNLNPTSDPDVRRSLSAKGEPQKRYGNYNIYGKDVRYEAPMQEQVAPTQETVSKTETVEGYAPITEEEANALQSDNVDSLTDADAPPEMEAPYYGETQDAATIDPFEDRDMKEVSRDRKTPAYMYENPEVKPFFQAEANILLGELERVEKPETIYNGWAKYEMSYEAAQDIPEIYRTERIASDTIVYLRDTIGMSYADIEKGLKAIIEDNGAENIAAAKKLEFVINDRLLYGYNDDGGFEIPANQDYINLLTEKEIREYSEEARKQFFDVADAYAPQGDIAPVAESKAAPVKEKYEAIKPPKQTKEPSLKRVKDADDIAPTESKTAEIYDTEPDTGKKKSRGWARFRANFLDKQSVFEDLALKTNNRELMGKANYILSAEQRAQRLIGKGKSNAGVKSLNDIRAEVESTGKTKQFYEYLYHKHNIDRMSLEESKPVFGDSVTADVSRAEVAKYEATNPKFTEYAQDVYDYMNYLRDQMVESGVISQETADLWAQMYPHYVPIRRLGDTGLNINVPLDTGRTGVNAPIKKATGGSRDILPLFDTMALRTEQTYKAIAKNNFGVELKNTLGSTIESAEANLDEMIDSVDAHEELLKKGENGKNPTFTVFEDGKKVTFEITEDMYDALKPTSDDLRYTNKVANTIGNIHRGLLTEYNPTFMLTNAIKDAQDILINSQHPAKTYANLPNAIAQMAKNGTWYQEYLENGGESNTYFDGQSNTFTKDDTGIKKIIGMPLRAISALNNYVERAPRLAEYIASRKAGASAEVAMLDAARVTTNFAAGGDVTKWANRNGFTFLNASVQGAMQQVRNVREAKANGLKGWVQLATKVALAGIPAMILNNLLWDDDEEYEQLSDYVKDNYYVVAKFGDGQFVRIPKGRAMAVIQDAFEQVGNALTGNDEVDLANFLELVISNLAPTNPLESNIIAPISQALTNKTWYGEDLVPTRLQDLPAAEQYDESTDSISKWLGEKLNVSPYKLNYLLNQYSGGVGDVVLPMLTPEAESGDNSLVGNLIAPMKDKFTTDSVMNNQNVSDFYDTVDELAANAKSSYATDEDILKYKYMNSVNAELSELYKKKREIQNSNIADKYKYEAVREVQKRIDELAEESLNTYGNVLIDDGYAVVGDRYYRLNANGEWVKITDKQLDKQEEVTSGLGINPAAYWENKSEYDFAYEHPGKYGIAKSVGGYENYKTYSSDLYDIKADKDENGKSISGSRKDKVAKYINNLDISYEEKIILFKSEYPADDSYNAEIVNYLNNREDISYDEMVAILKELGFTVKGNTVTWD